jgi:hypothetical protein
VMGGSTRWETAGVALEDGVQAGWGPTWPTDGDSPSTSSSPISPKR